MAKKQLSVVEAGSAIYEILEPLEGPERQRAVAGAMALLGESMATVPEQGGLATPEVAKHPALQPGDLHSYLAEKEPGSKVEKLAVAARYAELRENLPTLKKEDFQRILEAAGEYFDGEQFSQDIWNARKKGLFKVPTNGTYSLSAPGQQYVDALPNRQEAKKVRLRPSTRSGKAPARKGRAASRKSPAD